MVPVVCTSSGVVKGASKRDNNAQQPQNMIFCAQDKLGNSAIVLRLSVSHHFLHQISLDALVQTHVQPRHGLRDIITS